MFAVEVVAWRVVLRVEAAVHLEMEGEAAVHLEMEGEAAVHLEMAGEAAVVDQQCERAEDEEPMMGVVVGVVMGVVPFPIHQDMVMGRTLLVFHNERRVVAVLLAVVQRCWRKAVQLRYAVLRHQLKGSKTHSVWSQYWLKMQSEHCLAGVEEHPYKIPSFEGVALVEILPSWGVRLGKMSVQTSQKANEQEFLWISNARIPPLVPEGPVYEVL